MIKMKIFSDYICPFCYIGGEIVEKLNLEYDLDVEWHGLEIHPETHSEGADLNQLFGKERLQGMFGGLKQMADAYNLPLVPQERMPNSLHALEAAEFARSHGKHHTLHNALMRAYFAEQKDIGDVAILKDLAQSIGLDASELEAALSSGQFRPKIEADALEARRLGIHSTPTFIINDEITVSGAQPLEQFRKILNKIPQ